MKRFLLFFLLLFCLNAPTLSAQKKIVSAPTKAAKTTAKATTKKTVPKTTAKAKTATTTKKKTVAKTTAKAHREKPEPKRVDNGGYLSAREFEAAVRETVAEHWRYSMDGVSLSFGREEHPDCEHITIEVKYLGRRAVLTYPNRELDSDTVDEAASDVIDVLYDAHRRDNAKAAVDNRSAEDVRNFPRRTDD